MTQQQYVIAKDMFLQGKSLRQISEELNINRKKLSKKLKSDGVSTSRFISSSTINQAIEMFGTKSTTAIANELNIDRQVLTRELRKRGYLTKKMITNGKAQYDYDNQMAKSIVNNYNNMSIKSISDKYNVSTNTVQKILSHYDIDTNKQYEGYPCNEHVFDDIDTEHKAYWLGFLYADGTVGSDRNILELGLKYSDKTHVEKFKSFMESEAPIKDRDVILNGKTYKACRINIGSKHLKQSLIDKGCVPNKSLILTFPTKVPKHLIHHFMRGYFDGDGSIGISKGQLRFSVLGTKEFLDSYIKELGLHKNKYQPNGKAFSTGYGGNNLCRQIYDFLYKGATVYLERKRSKFTAVLG